MEWYSFIIETSVQVVSDKSSLFVVSNNVSHSIIYSIMFLVRCAQRIKFLPPFQSFHKLIISLWQHQFTKHTFSLLKTTTTNRTNHTKLKRHNSGQRTL